MHITCEGKAYELFEGATPQNLWNMVSRGRDPETAVLADCEGDIIDFQTPFTGDTDVKWIPLGSPLAHRAYQRSLIMLLAIAAKEVYGGKIEVAVKHALGKALYCEFSDGHVPLQKELDVLRYKMEEIVKEGRDITQLTVGISKAEAFLRLKGRKADADLVTQMPVKEISVSQCGTFIDYFFGPMLPDMSFLKIFHLSSYAPGFLLHVPDPGEKEIKVQEETPLFARVFLESQKWSELIGCHSLAELNDAIDGGAIIDLIAVAEALHEKKLAELADEICGQDPGIRLVCIAGPSSSGKTTFMKRLIIHLWVNGVHPVMLSLDDYFKNRDEMEGESWENLQAMDISLFEKTVINLLEGKEVTWKILKDSWINYWIIKNIKGDVAFVFKTSVLRNYLFDDIPGEKFCAESLVLNRIGKNYLMLFFNEKIYIAEYLSDGLSVSSIKNRMNSPNYAMRIYSEMASLDIPYLKKIKAHINYWRFAPCSKLKMKNKIKQIGISSYIIFMPIGYLFHMKDKKNNYIDIRHVGSKR